MHESDAILQKACPTIMVPRFGEFEPLTDPGHRYLAADSGLWIELKRTWLNLFWPVALQNSFTMPYGPLEKKIEFAFDHIPLEMLDLFIADATAALPNEAGAWLIWDEKDKKLKYRLLRSIKAEPDYLEVDRPSLADHEFLAVDLHSHAFDSAYFSPRDDGDDRHEVKISGVIGRLGEEQPEMVFRLCTGGKFINLRSPRQEAHCNASPGPGGHDTVSDA